VVRAGLRMLLEAHKDLQVVGEAVDGITGVQRALELRPDVVVMDITMGGPSGFVATREIRARLPDTKVLVLTIHNSEEYLRQMLEAGATGYVLKQAADAELAVAIRAVQRGEVYVYPSFTRGLLRGLSPREDAERGAPRDGLPPLSEREKQVLRLVSLGYTNQQIADQLCLSVKTIETYRARLMEKLNIRSRAALVRYALEKGLLDKEADDALKEA
jgi:two-component system, NarL family, response regulator NreC